MTVFKFLTHVIYQIRANVVDRIEYIRRSPIAFNA